MRRLADRLQQRIARDGALRFDHFMNAALGDPEGGYYMTRDPLGLAGDFVTSPEISQIFGELLGIWLVECWQQLGSPNTHLVELGPGRGTLMNDMLRATCHVPHFHDALTVHLVEMSPTLRSVQQQTLAGKHPRIFWHDTLPECEKPILLVANEFYDALPIRQFEALRHGFSERCVGWDEAAQRFCFVSGETHATLPTAYPDIAAGALAEGSVVEVCEAAQHITRDLAAQIATLGGAMLAIDYGYVRSDHPAQAGIGDTLQAVRQHQFHSVLENPGGADITAHVDFSVLADIAREAGAKVPRVLSQHDFLNRMGGKIRLEQLLKHASSPEQQQALSGSYERLVSVNEMGNLFKVMAVVSPTVTAPIFEG